ncbi:MAG: OsmC family protein [Leptolinea sp.]|nr:OsmC family protein [Leptolinea sp.]
MSSARVKWIGGKQFVGIDSTNHSVVLSTADEGVGMKPSELLLVALASCSSVDVVEIMAKKRTPLDFMEVSASAEQDTDPPWTFRKIHLTYRVRGKGILEKNIAQAIELSEKKYCSVASTLSGVAEITTSYELLPEE